MFGLISFRAKVCLTKLVNICSIGNFDHICLPLIRFDGKKNLRLCFLWLPVQLLEPNLVSVSINLSETIVADTL